MNLLPSSEHDKKHFVKFASIFFGTGLLICIVMYGSNKFIPSETSNSRPSYTINTQSPSDSIDLVKADFKLVHEFELAWGADRVNLKDALDNIAGVKGKTQWKISYKEAQRESNPETFIASCHAVNADRKKTKTFDIKLLVNRPRKRFKVLSAVDNGEVLKGPMIIMTLALKGGYTQAANF